MAMKHARRIAVAALALVTTVGMASCSGATVSGGGGDAKDATLIYDLGMEMTTLDPAAIFDVSASTVDSEIYEQLLDYKTGTDELEPELAESWESNADATEYRFKLKSGVSFESGGTLTSADVVFAFNRLKNLQGPPAYLMDGLTVTADGDDTVVISSDTPRPELLSMLPSTNFSVYDSAAVKAAGGTDAADAAKTDKAGTVFGEKSFGSGMYSLKSYEPNAEVRLSLSKNWRGDKPDFPSIIIRNSRSIQQQILNIQNGGSDVTNSLSSPQVAELDQSKVNVISQPLPQVIYMGLTNSSGPTTNADFRKAIALGLDYDGLVKIAGKGAAQGTSVIPTSLVGSLPESEALKRDVEGAKQALADSGMADKKVTISFGSDYTVGGQDMALFAQKIQSDLEEVGITVELDGAPTQVSRTANQEGKVQIALWPFPPDFADPSQFLIFSPGGVVAQRQHWEAKDAPKIAELGKKAAAVIDPTERATAYQEWARAVRDSYQYIAVVEVPQNLVTSKRVGNLNMDVTGAVRLGALTLEKQ